MLYTHLLHHNDTIIKTQWQRQTQEVFFNKILPLTLFVRVRKGCVGFHCERELEIEHNCIILTPLLWPSRCVFLVLLMLNRRPRGSLCWVICYILSATSQVPKLHRGSRGPPWPGVAFPTTSHLQLAWNSNSTALAPWASNSTGTGTQNPTAPDTANCLNFRLDCVI